ncbi:MAG: oligosaccharide repeat unit polymerase [Clostridia bacterium]|nr:oligosaccharide repeat unit polymerase [Clostridia bacterium]
MINSNECINNTDFSLFSQGYAKLFLKLFVYISIIEFSFAPWLSLYSGFTNICSKVLYICWFGLLFMTISFSVFMKGRIKKILLLLFVFFIYILYGILNAGLEAVISFFSSFFLPVFVAMFFYSRKNDFSKKEIASFIILLNICCFINCAYALYLIATFDGVFTKLYVAKADYNLYNYIRGNRLRAFGFLNSAVIFSNYVVLVFILNLLRIKKKEFFFIRILFLTLCLISLYFSGSRMPFFALIVSCGSIFCFNKYRKFVFVISIFSIAFLIFFLTIGSNLDLSALGRITQYLEGLNLFLHNPFGYGFGYAGFPSGIVSFDCSLLTIPVNFGILGVLILFIYYFKSIKYIAYDNNQKTCDIIVINLFLLSGFVNVIHFGILTLVVICYFIKKQGIKND